MKTTKTIAELTKGKTYRQLTALDKELIQERQTALVIAWQDETDQLKRLELEDELMSSLKGLIKGIAYIKARDSFSLEQDDFEGIISLALAETMIKFDRTLDKPFQPIFLLAVRFAISEVYRSKGYDLHDTSFRQQETEDFLNQGTSSAEVLNGSKQLISRTDHIGNAETTIVTDELLTDLFGNNEVKKTIVHMTIQGFKRNEIVTAINTEGKATDTVAKQVNRVVNQFKAHYVNSLQSVSV